MAKTKPKRTAANRYLWFREDARHIWFRLRVPDRYRAIAGTGLVQESLGTSNIVDARMLRDRRRGQLFEEWGALEPLRSTVERRTPTDYDLEEAAVAICHDLALEEEKARRLHFRGADPELWSMQVDILKEELEDQRRCAATGDPRLVRRFADEAVEALGYELRPDGDRFEKLCDHLNIARLAALKVSYEHATGEVEAMTDSKLVSRVRDRAASTAPSGESITELFEVYATERVAAKTKRPAGVHQDRMVIDLFAEFVGRDRFIGSITYEDAKEFVDALGSLPSGYKKKGIYRGMSVRQAIEKGEREGDRAISVITQQRYISTVSPFFQWLKGGKGGRRIRENPFPGLHKDTSKIRGTNPRPPFTAMQITAIINSPLFTGFLGKGKEHVHGDEHADDWRHWLPLICLFTGARIGEVAQLYVGDIYRDRDIWSVELRHDDKTGRFTKSGKSRSVALHSTLIAIGFLRFVERQKERSENDGDPQLFPGITPGARGQYGDEPSAWWRDYLAAIGVKSAESGAGFGSHSFRHTMADQLRAAGHMDYVFGPLILGHSTRTVTGGYGEANQGTPERSSMMIESVKFVPIERGKTVDGGKPVDFSHLMWRN